MSKIVFASTVVAPSTLSMNHPERTNIAHARPNEHVSYGGQSITLVPVDGLRAQQFVRTNDSQPPPKPKPWATIVTRLRATLTSVKLSRLIRNLGTCPSASLGRTASSASTASTASLDSLCPSPAQSSPLPQSHQRRLSFFNFQPHEVVDRQIDAAKARILAIYERDAAEPAHAPAPAASPTRHLSVPAPIPARRDDQALQPTSGAGNLATTHAPLAPQFPAGASRVAANTPILVDRPALLNPRTSSPKAAIVNTDIGIPPILIPPKPPKPNPDGGTGPK
ncbi:hypothetical protein UC34_01080 [Pandoraea vervacti]|uniref:Uncharacterized protein n=1 Tax=Pandoraea vervacti TaxID=656178 RepID=A0ABM5SU25_9BURK|nr:hypothetical protein [Pandoraea vervacti]AJP55962.1 hypothetical protein UC34_01080 [Pandoraea vervacti]